MIVKARKRWKETEIGQIPEDWNTKKVGELGKVVTGKTPPTSNQNFYGAEYPFIKIPDMGQSVYVRNSKIKVSSSGAEHLRRLKLPKNTVMVSCIATIGKVGVTSTDSFTNQQINALIPRKEVVHPLWIYYFFKNNKEYLESRGGGGSVYTNISKTKFENLLVSTPNLTEQEQIIKVLFSLDAKIELNRQMNQSLESIAEALFKRWFVDFEFPDENGQPYKSSGGKMVQSELGQIPEGWAIRKMSEIIELAYGKALKDEDRLPGNIPVYGSNGQVGVHNTALAKGPGIVVGRKGNPGIVKWVNGDFFPIDTTFFVKLTGSLQSIYYAYFALRNEKLDSLGADSAVPGLSRNIAYMNKIVQPTSEILFCFDKQIEVMFNFVNHNELQNRELEEIRDSLLPRLMSGKIRVQE